MQLALGSLAPGVAVPIAPPFLCAARLNEGLPFGGWFSGPALVLAAITTGIIVCLPFGSAGTSKQQQALGLEAILGGAEQQRL
jgi:lipoprotein signal peptidase